ncbi:hypothetical protein GX48_04334 [Paracoccidioides brasiliensis]|nr:hypothetical protein GX48_04334 [Paracoccidioides brasiliensis]
MGPRCITCWRVHATDNCGGRMELFRRLLLEAFTILDALNIYPCPWAERVLLESYKLWFYSMVFGIAGITWQLFGPASSSTNQDTKPNGTNQEIEKNGSKKGREGTSDGSNVNADACRLQRSDSQHLADG